MGRIVRALARDGVLVGEFDRAAAGERAVDGEFIVVARGSAVGEFESRDDEEDAGGFEFAVRDAARAEEFGAGDLEPDGIGRVMGDAHGVALAVADADLRLALHGWGRGGLGARGLGS